MTASLKRLNEQLREAHVELATEKRLHGLCAAELAEAQARIAQLEAALRDGKQLVNYLKAFASGNAIMYDVVPWLNRIHLLLAGSESETQVRQAHSKSEYKRFTALGVECSPPETACTREGHVWVEVGPSEAPRQKCDECGITKETKVDEPCRIYEYDGMYKCYAHHKSWGATTKPDQPCAGWSPEKIEGKS